MLELKAKIKNWNSKYCACDLCKIYLQYVSQWPVRRIKFFVLGSFDTWEQVCSRLWVCSHLLRWSPLEDWTFYAMRAVDIAILYLSQVSTFSSTFYYSSESVCIYLYNLIYFRINLLLGWEELPPVSSICYRY